ncbi:MAG: HK97 family phage prohead protease [Rhodoblastus sp.]|nr:MAG: HK97 family phage prohead protease [Rhodoblastus sp.]
MSAVALQSGVFAGYASLFGETDLGGDVVAPGAFRASLRKRGPGGVRMLFQHDPAQPIGTWLDIAEDAKGLRVVGKLNLDVARARELAALIRDGALDGLHRLQDDPLRPRPGGARKLLALDLWEISLVTFPMLPGARVGAKGAIRRVPVAPRRVAQTRRRGRRRDVIATIARRSRHAHPVPSLRRALRRGRAGDTDASCRSLACARLSPLATTCWRKCASCRSNRASVTRSIGRRSAAPAFPARGGAISAKAPSFRASPRRRKTCSGGAAISFSSCACRPPFSTRVAHPPRDRPQRRVDAALRF